jgi:hypothetical protein
MRAIRVCVLGSSTAAGTNLSSPTTERWPAHYASYIAAARPGSTVALVARASLNTYHALPTGTTNPGNRDAVDTSFNITTAIATSPNVIIVNINSDFGRAHDTWGVTDFTTPGTGYVDAELIPNLQTIADEAEALGIQVWFTDGQPVDTGWGGLAITQAEIDARVYGKSQVQANWPTRFIPFWAVLAAPDGTITDADVLVDGVHPDAGITPALSDAVEQSTLEAQFEALDMATPLDIVSSVTSLSYCSFEAANVTLSGSIVTAVDELTANDYDLAPIATDKGGTYEPTGMRGRPSILFNGTDEALTIPAALANALAGGVDNTGYTIAAIQRVSAGTSGDCWFSCGDTGTANKFYRLVEGNSATQYEFRVRNAASGSGEGGVGGTLDGNAHVVEIVRRAASIVIAVDGSEVVNSATASVDLGTLNIGAWGCLTRNTNASFANIRFSDPYHANAEPNGTERTNLVNWYKRFTTDPVLDVTHASGTGAGQSVGAAITLPVTHAAGVGAGQDVSLQYYNLAVTPAVGSGAGQSVGLIYSGAAAEAPSHSRSTFGRSRIRGR